MDAAAPGQRRRDGDYSRQTLWQGDWVAWLPLRACFPARSSVMGVAGSAGIFMGTCWEQNAIAPLLHWSTMAHKAFDLVQMQLGVVAMHIACRLHFALD